MATDPWPSSVIEPLGTIPTIMQRLIPMPMEDMVGEQLEDAAV